MLDNRYKDDSFSRDFTTRPLIGPSRICAKLIIMRAFQLIRIDFEISNKRITFSFRMEHTK